MHRNGKTAKILIVAGATILLAAIFFFSSTGFYTKVPEPGAGKAAGARPGETVWFLKRGTDFGFANSADGIAMNQGLSPNDRIRTTLDAEFERLIEKKILFRFGFSRALYLMTTGNIDFYTPDEPAKADAQN